MYTRRLSRPSSLLRMHVTSCFLVLTCVALLSPCPASGARVLALFGVSGTSHNIVFRALTTELARRGHDLTVVTAYPMKNPPGKYRQIEVAAAREVFGSVNDFSQQNVLQKIKGMWDTSGSLCPNILKLPEVTKLLDEKFDLVIASVVLNDCCIPFAHHNKAPLIFISPAGTVTWTSASIGNPEPAAYVPSLLSPFSDQMTFGQRALNLVLPFLLQTVHSYLYVPRMDAVVREVFGPDTPTIAELSSQASLFLINNHVSINYPRPLVPNVIEVGGMHVEPAPQPLPKDLQTYLDGAAEGAIYFSMGSLLQAAQLPREKMEMFLAAFSELPQRVLWKWESDTMPGQPANVKLGKWLPQQAILAHPNVRLFITHGGLLSTQESVYHGVPLVGVPMFGDQALNVLRSEMLGFAVGLDFETLSPESISSAIKKALNTPSYNETAKTLMRRMRDQPQTPLDRAVFWTEYVIRHKGAPHLRSAALDLAWYQLYLLDVAAAILVTLLLLLLALRGALRLCCGGAKEKTSLAETAKKEK